MMPFESAVRGSLDGSHGGRLDAHNEADHRAVTPLYGALLRLLKTTHSSRQRGAATLHEFLDAGRTVNWSVGAPYVSGEL